MNEKDFNKGIDELKNIRLSKSEKENILKKVMSAPVESPFVKHSPIFISIFTRHTQVFVAASLVFVISFGGVIYASDESLPGDILYPVKTAMVEPILDVVYGAPEKKLAWEEKKVERRIAEAEKLIEKDELDEEKLAKLEAKIERSSSAFAEAADNVASSTGTSTLSRKEKANNLKREFRGRINERQGIFDRVDDEEKVKFSDDTELGIRVKVEDAEKVLNKLDDDLNIQKEKIKRLQNAAIKILDDEDHEDEDEDRDDD